MNECRSALCFQTNSSLPLSHKMAYAIMEATGAEPVQLSAGANGKALDMMGQEYSKDSTSSSST